MLQIFQEEVLICLPPHYCSMDTFTGAFEDELEPLIESNAVLCSTVLCCALLCNTIECLTLSDPFAQSPQPALPSLPTCSSPPSFPLAELVEQPSELEVVEILLLIDWLEYFNEQMLSFGYEPGRGPNQLQCMVRFTTIAEDLLRCEGHRSTLCCPV
jgi:hypothetical protein